MVAIFPLIGETFLEPGSQVLPVPSLRLGKPLGCLSQLLGMGNLLTIRQGEQVRETRINPYRCSTCMRNSLGLRVDEQAEIPARGTLDDASTCDASLGDILSMEPHMTYPWHMDVRAIERAQRIGKGDAGELVPLAFEPGLLRQLLIAPLPGRIGGVEHALQRMTRNAERFAMVGEQIVKGFLGVIDAVVGIEFNLTDSPIPHAGELQQPGGELLFLRAVEA